MKLIKPFVFTVKWNDANCAMEHPFVCEKSKDSMSIMPIKEIVLPLTFSDGTGDQCPPGYSTFGG